MISNTKVICYHLRKRFTNCFQKPKESTKYEVILFHRIETHCLTNIHSKIKKTVKWYLQLSVEESSSSLVTDTSTLPFHLLLDKPFLLDLNIKVHQQDENKHHQTNMHCMAIHFFILVHRAFNPVLKTFFVWCQCLSCKPIIVHHFFHVHVCIVMWD